MSRLKTDSLDGLVLAWLLPALFYYSVFNMCLSQGKLKKMKAEPPFAGQLVDYGWVCSTDGLSVKVFHKLDYSVSLAVDSLSVAS